MPAASKVRPAKWTNLCVLFDDGVYSVVSGSYEGNPASALGERWNGEPDGLGFPNQAGYPVWHVIPGFLAVPILHGLLDELARHPNDLNRAQAAEILRVLETVVST
jgi:hypothetical protein